MRWRKKFIDTEKRVDQTEKRLDQIEETLKEINSGLYQIRHEINLLILEKSKRAHEYPIEKEYRIAETLEYKLYNIPLGLSGPQPCCQTGNTLRKNGFQLIENFHCLTRESLDVEELWVKKEEVDG